MTREARCRPPEQWQRLTWRLLLPPGSGIHQAQPSEAPAVRNVRRSLHPTWRPPAASCSGAKLQLGQIRHPPRRHQASLELQDTLLGQLLVFLHLGRRQVQAA